MNIIYYNKYTKRDTCLVSKWERSCLSGQFKNERGPALFKWTIKNERGPTLVDNLKYIGAIILEII